MHSGLPHVYPSVVHMLADAAQRSPDATALVCGDRRLSYGDTLRCVAALAHELVQGGARGGRVALVCANSLDLPIALFAVHAAGAQAVAINPAYTGRELAFLLEDAAPQLLIYDAEVAATVEPLAARLGIANSLRIGAGRAGRDLAAAGSAATLPQPLPAAAELASLQYTGGTSGLPKGVDISHGRLAVNISQREAALPTRPDEESVLCVMPLFHVFAISMCLHLAVYCRSKLVIMPRYKPDLLLGLIESERITRLPAGPTVFMGLLAHERFAGTDFSSLRTAYSGSAPLPEATLARWEARVGTPILEGYGQTEAGPVLTYVRESGPRRAGSVGPALPLTEIQIVDVDSGSVVLAPGELGEIRARGPQIMAGYRNRPAETAAALRDGWLYTGDIGELDADGCLYIRDRKKDMISVGGYKVYPREVDEVLCAHADVAEAATIGVADAYYGEVVHAHVVLRAGAATDVAALLNYCRANLARYKVPAQIHLRPALPRTAVGKVDKNGLKQAEP